MSTEVGHAYVTLLPSAKGFGASVKKEISGKAAGPAREEGERAGKALSGGFLPSLKGIALGIGALGVATGFISLVGQARAAAAAARITAQVIKTTGGAAHVTAASIRSLATSISDKTGVDDDAIVSGENLLLTFTGIRNEVGKGNDIFNRATQTVTDMSVALGQDTKSSAIQLGKALNDPIKGVTALQRVGVSFTQSQKDQIKTLVASGNTLGAQKLILAELGREFGGAAQAASDPLGRLKATGLNLAKDFAGKLLPVIDKIATFLVANVIPAATRLAGAFQKNVVPVIKTLAAQVLPVLIGYLRQVWSLFQSVLPTLVSVGRTVAGAIVTGFKFLFGLIRDNRGVILAVVGAFVAYQAILLVLRVVGAAFAAVQAVINAVMDANIFALVVLAVIAFAAGLIYAYKHSETFRNIVQSVWSAVKSAISVAWAVIKDVINALIVAWNALAAVALWLWHNVLIPAWTAIQVAFTVAKTIIAVVIIAIMLYVQLLGNIFMWLWRNIIQPVWTGISAVIGAAWRVVGVYFAAFKLEIRVLASIFMWLWHTVIVPVFNGIKSVIGTVWNSGVKPIFDKIVAAVKFMGGIFSSIFGGISSVVSSAFGGLVSIMKGPINFVIGLINDFIRAIDKIHIHIPSILGVGGFDFGLSIPTIPQLAGGGMIVGDGLFRGGEGGKKEAVIPLEDPRTLAMLKQALGGGSRKIAENLTLASLDPDELADAVVQRQRRADLLVPVPA